MARHRIPPPSWIVCALEALAHVAPAPGPRHALPHVPWPPSAPGPGAIPAPRAEPPPGDDHLATLAALMNENPTTADAFVIGPRPYVQEKP